MDLTLDGTGTLPIGQLATFTSGVGRLSGTDHTFTGLANASGTAFIVDAVAADLSGVTNLSLGSVTLNAGGSADLTNASNIDGASFVVNDGVTLSLPAATAYAHASTGNSQLRTFRAFGAGSRLDLSNLTGITNGSHWNSDIAIEAFGGGTVDLKNVTQIVDFIGGDTHERVMSIAADGAGSLIDLTALMNFHDANPDRVSSLIAGNQGTIDVDAAAVSFVNVTVDLGASPPSPLVNSTAADSFQATVVSEPDGTVSASNEILPPAPVGLASMVGRTTQWIGADGDWSDPSNWSTGEVPGTLDDVVIDLVATDVTITISGGSREVRSLHSEEAFVISGGSLRVSRDSQVNAAFTMAAGTSLIVDGAAASFTATQATTAAGGNFFALGGGHIVLPNLTGYTHASTGNSQLRTFRAWGSGSLLDLSNLTGITNGSNYNSDISIEALAGGHVDLKSVTSILDNAGGDTNERVVGIAADGTGSLIDLGSLTTFHDANAARRSTLVARNGGTVQAGNLTDLQAVDVTLDGTGTLPISQITTFTSGVARLSGVDHTFSSLANGAGTAFIVNGVHADLSGVTDLSMASVTLSGGGTADLDNAGQINGASFFVNDGVTLSLPAATTYLHASTGNSQTRTFRARGSGSLLDLSTLTGITNGSHWNSEISIEALTGGQIDLGSVTQIVDNAGGDTREREVWLTSDGVGSQIDLTALATFEDANGDRPSLVTVRNRGNVDVNPLGTLLERVHVNIASESTISGSLELLPESVLEGSGRLVGDLLNRSLIWPVGELIVDGDFTQTDTGKLVIDIGGLTPITEHDQFTVTGAANVDGTLEVTLTGGFAPTNGDSFRVMTFASRTGVFDYEGLDTGAGAELSPELTPVDLTLVAGFSTGPSVIALAGSDSSVATDGPFIDVTFSEPIDLATFTVDDVAIVGPGGPIGFQPPELVAGTVNVYRIRLEPSQFVDGTHDLTIGPDVLDFVGNPMNQDGDGLNGEPIEDVFTGQVDVFLPDLAVDPPLVDPIGAQFGEDLDVSWTVRNAGASTAAGPWEDTVWLSTDAVPDAGDVLLASIAAGADSPLAVSGTYARLVTVSLPILAQLVTGTYYVIVTTDELNVTAESNEANNATASVPLDLTFPAMPDLQVTVDAAPTSGQPGQSVPFSWTVDNAGDATAAGPWVDRLFLSADGQLAGATLMASVVRSGDLADGADYTATIDVVLPAVADGDYTLIVVTDADDEVFEGLDEANNQDTADANLQMRHADLVPVIVSAPASALSGDEITVRWNTTNSGTTSTLAGWSDRVYLSDDQQLSGDDRLLGEVSFSGPLGVTQSESGELTAALPVDVSGSWNLIVVTDAAGEIGELGGEANNRVTRPIDVQLAPYADLVVTNVDGPGRVIGDPATVTVTWSVENQGTGAGLTDTWTDALIASTDDVLGNADDTVLARFDHTGGLNLLADYSRTESILLGPSTTGRFHLFVKTDVDDVVFENGLETNNGAESDEILDVMAIPYADLVVTSIDVDPTASSGQTMDVTWTVENRGIGTTSPGQWTDRVFLATDPAGDNRILTLGAFDRFGPLAPGDDYTRTGVVSLPNGLEGTHYVVVVTGGPFEFIYTDNNTLVSGPVDVLLTPAPDLTVTEVLAPADAEEGSSIDVTWTVKNLGTGAAEGSWVDQVYLEKVGDPNATRLELGTFRYDGPLIGGTTYTRSEELRLPEHFSDLYDVVVTTNFDGTLYEQGQTANNTRSADSSLAVSIQPRPDLVVLTVDAPSDVDAGGTLSVDFVVANQAGVATTQAHWTDRVYLSLDNVKSRDDLLISEHPNQAALGPNGDSYQTSSGTIVVPKRFRGEVYVLVIPDADEEMDEWPGEENNLAAEPVFVNPLPLADLVASDVIAPTQAIEGSQIEVRYTVTNLGAGETDVDTWTDTIWLTRDKNRPHPGHGDLLLASLVHSGSLVENAGYDEIVNVTLPEQLLSGAYYIMPWTDPYAVVLEDTLAINVNPDDPNEIDNYYYKARAIDILGAKPDLAVTAVDAATSAMGGELFTVDWTVQNQSSFEARPEGWVDRVYLSTGPDPFAAGTKNLILGEVTHGGELGPNQSYDGSLSVTLSPSALGSYVVVVTDDDFALTEISEDNNQAAFATDVEPVPADLVVSNIIVPPVNYSGEPATIRYTVTNQGNKPVWAGTEYWSDFIWISADPTFIQGRSTYLTTNLLSNAIPLGPGQSDEVEFQVTLPKGIDGDYYIHVHHNAHNDLSPDFVPLLARSLMTDWWPAETGSNSGWLGEFQRWAYEDPTNNLASEPISVTYREPDLKVTNLDLPAGAESGETIPVQWTVTNQGTRDTRETAWTDRLFLSRDSTLDRHDLYLGEKGHHGALPVGQSYTSTTDVRLPDGIEGTFHVLAATDAQADRSESVQSDIGTGLPGVEFAPLSFLLSHPPPLQDWVDEAPRSMARGVVHEYQDEANNLTAEALPVTLAQPPDLQVTVLEVPPRATTGQEFDLTYEVTNLGGATPSTQDRWDDLIYLSRDEFLDLAADRYLGFVEHEEGLAGSGKYIVDTSMPLPAGLVGPYFVIVVTDPVRTSPIGRVFEHEAERNNDRASDVPMVIELPPPSDLEVSLIGIPDSARTGEPVQLQWTVTNNSSEPATGAWADAAYLSTDPAWDVTDRPIGKVSFEGTLLPGESYTSVLDTVLPTVTPGDYRVIVRADIFNQVYEDVGELNNRTASQDTLDVTVQEILLDVPLETTLSTGLERLFAVNVPTDQTLRVTLTAGSEESANQLFLRHDAAPTSANFDATHEGVLSHRQTAIIPSTEPGVYYILIRGFSEPADGTPVVVLAELMPLSITEVRTDAGGDSRYVTTTIRGARFHQDAIVKLVRPGFAEYEPELWEIIDGTKIIASFDLSGAPHGLYDLKVINPADEEAVVPYRFQVERAIEPEVTIGIGGPRAVLAGDVGTYSVALKGIGNLDTPYVFFEVGMPELGIHELLYELPYLAFGSNVRGGPETGGLENVAWASLDSAVNTDGHVTAGGYMFDQHADGFTGFTFNVETYPGLKELHDRAWEGLKAKLYAVFPHHAEAGTLDDGPEGLDLIYPGLFDIWINLGAVPELWTYELIPFQFHVAAAATAMTRDEFIVHATGEASTLRQAILQDDEASPAVLAEAPDGSILASGGPSRSWIWQFAAEGGEAAAPWAELDHPVFNLAFDAVGDLWATTGGGPLLRLNPNTGDVVGEFGDGLGIALAVEPATGSIYVSSSRGVEIFDPTTLTFEHFSRDRNLRVGGLAFAADGSLWATTWPDRTQVVRFNERGRAELMLQFDAPIDSLAFGQTGTSLANLLFVSHNRGPASGPGGGSSGSDLTMVDVTTLRSVAVAQGGTRGDVVTATSDGRVLLSQSGQIDVLSPAVPPSVIGANPPDGAVAALPWSLLTVSFDSEMFVGDSQNAASVINPDNYRLVGDGAGNVPLLAVNYDTTGRTVYLLPDHLVADRYELTVGESIRSDDNLALGIPFVTEFTTASNFSPFVDIVFADTRSSRNDQTVSYEVTVTNVGQHDLLLPLLLVFDPAAGYEGVPTGSLGQDAAGRWLIDLSADMPDGQRLAPGESTAGRTITILHPADQRVDYRPGVSADPTANVAPEFVSDPVTDAVAGVPYV